MCCRSVLKGRSLLSDTGRLALRRPGAAVSPSADLARPAPICRSIRPFTGQRSAAAIFVSIFQCRHRLLECAGARAVPAPGVCPLSQIVDGRPGRCRGMGFCPGLNGCRGYFWHFISAVRPGARMMALVSAPLCRLSPPLPSPTGLDASRPLLQRFPPAESFSLNGPPTWPETLDTKHPHRFSFSNYSVGV